MEEMLTLDELYMLVEAMYRKEHRHNKVLAALQGVDLDEKQRESDFEKIKLKAAADLAGKNEDEFVFNLVGIEVDDEDE